VRGLGAGSGSAAHLTAVWQATGSVAAASPQTAWSPSPSPVLRSWSTRAAPPVGPSFAP